MYLKKLENIVPTNRKSESVQVEKIRFYNILKLRRSTIKAAGVDNDQVSLSKISDLKKLFMYLLIDILYTINRQKFLNKKKFAVGRTRTYAPRGNLISSQTP